MNLANLRVATEKNKFMSGRELRHAAQMSANRRQSGPMYGKQTRALNNVNKNSNYISSNQEQYQHQQQQQQKQRRQFGSSSSLIDDDESDNGNNNGNNFVGGDDSDLSASRMVRQKVHNDNDDLQTAAGHHHHGHDHHGYYQYVEVPKKKAWKYGFKRGNHKHTIEKHEKGHKNKFHTTFKWHALEKCKKKSKCKSVGKMSWDYKHHDKKHHK